MLVVTGNFTHVEGEEVGGIFVINTVGNLLQGTLLSPERAERRCQWAR